MSRKSKAEYIGEKRRVSTRSEAVAIALRDGLLQKV